MTEWISEEEGEALLAALNSEYIVSKRTYRRTETVHLLEALNTGLDKPREDGVD